MKKKILTLLVVFCFIIPCAVILAGCGVTEITADILQLEYISTVYDGEVKLPAVKIKKNETFVLANEDCDISYSNNINSGIATVKVAAKDDSTFFKGEVELSFEIQKADTVDVNSFEDLVSELDYINYNKITYIGSDLIISDNLIIPTNAYVNFKDAKLDITGTFINYGKIELNKKPVGNIINVNNGEVVAKVGTRDALIDAFGYADYIELTSNISSFEGEKYLGDINVNSTERNYNFTLDLKGFNFESRLNFRTFNVQTLKPYPYSINVLVTSTAQKSTIGSFKEACSYGLVVIGDEKLKIEFNNIKAVGYYGGLVTNGSCEGSSIVANNCDFVGNEIGVYLPGKYTYEMTECSFTGFSGYYTKSGYHTLTECMFKGTAEKSIEPVFYGDGCYPTGSAFVCDSAKTYYSPVEVLFKQCEFLSIDGYGVEEVATSNDPATAQYYSTIVFDGNQTYVCPVGKSTKLKPAI